MPSLHAIVLAGGRSSRLGGIDKVMTVVGGRPLLFRAVEAVAPAEQVVVVGPQRVLDLPREVTWAREVPEFGGPAAGVAAGWTALAAAPDDEILILPADLVRPEVVVASLGRAGTIAVDPDGQRQWACVRIRSDDLGAKVRAAGELPGLSLRALFGTLDLEEVVVSHDGAADLDTPDDAKEYADEQ